jgi:hypothetical protein
MSGATKLGSKLAFQIKLHHGLALSRVQTTFAVPRAAHRTSSRLALISFLWVDRRPIRNSIENPPLQVQPVCGGNGVYRSDCDLVTRLAKGSRQHLSAFPLSLGIRFAALPQRSPRTGQWLSPENRPMRIASGTLFAASIYRFFSGILLLTTEQREDELLGGKAPGDALQRGRPHVSLLFLEDSK